MEYHARLPVPEGELIAGKYVVGKVLASGGMGVLAEGRHEALDQRVAIKFLLPEIAVHTEAIERFIREARAAAKIQSDHIVRVFDVGAHGDVPYMVMEFLEGHDLGDLMDRSGPLAVNDAIDIVAQALEGLAEAHALGIVHRDVKPSNIFIVSKKERKRLRRVKVLDFGISKILPEAAPLDRARTTTKSMLGSPGYMSPEQVRSTKNVDARTDVWAMGVILYELLTGEPAFNGETLGDVFARIREEPLSPIREKRPDVPVELEAVLMRCVARDRNDRYADAGALLDALAPFSTGAPSPSLPGVAPISSPRTLERAATQAAWTTTWERRPSRRWIIAAASAVLLVGLAIWIGRERIWEAPQSPIPTSPAVEAPTPSASAPVVASAPAPPVTAAASASAAPMTSWRPPLRPPPTPPPPAPAKKKDDLGI